MHGRHHAVYTLTDALKQGTNATIEIIQRELVKLEKDGNTQTHSDTDIGPPPPFSLFILLLTPTICFPRKASASEIVSPTGQYQQAK